MHRFASIASADAVTWPLIPTPMAAGMLAIQAQLEDTQWWSPSKLRAHQDLQLAALLRHARRTSPYYETRLAGLDIDTAGRLDPDGFLALPFLTREQLQANGDALRCRVIPPDHGDLTRHSSSGSTGRPVAVLATRLNDLWWRALLLRDHLWHERDFSVTLAVLKTRIKDRTSANWGAATAGVINTGPCLSRNSDIDLSQQVDWLAATTPAYLLTHASNLRALARYCLEFNIELPSLREVRSFGEMVAADLRELCRAAWDVRLVDGYSAAELGTIALQCPERDHYHVQSEHVLVEVLDRNNRPCEAGEEGRVVVTALHNFAMPLIRYELNDYAEVGAPCACGRGLPVLSRILGRKRNMLRLPHGGTHWPSFPTRVWDDTPVLQFQMVQATLRTITLRLVVDRPLSEVEQAGLFARLSECLQWDFEFEIDYVDAIDFKPGAEDFLSLVD